VQEAIEARAGQRMPQLRGRLRQRTRSRQLLQVDQSLQPQLYHRNVRINRLLFLLLVGGDLFGLVSVTGDATLCFLAINSILFPLDATWFRGAAAPARLSLHPPRLL